MWSRLDNVDQQRNHYGLSGLRKNFETQARSYAADVNVVI